MIDMKIVSSFIGIHKHMITQCPPCRQEIAQIRQSIDQQKYDLEAREAKLQSILSLIPSGKELQSSGITFDVIIRYVSARHSNIRGTLLSVYPAYLL